MTTTTSTSRRSSSSSVVRSGRFAVRCSVRADGDFHPMNVPPAVLASRRRRVADRPWTMLDQRHGTDVVRVTRPGEHDGAVGDAIVTDVADAVVAVWAADCAPVVLLGADREVAVVHAGWRGLAAGVIDAAVDAMREPVVGALLGPTIGPCCYEFGPGDLAKVAAGVHATHDDVVGVTDARTTALDVIAAVRCAVGHHGVDLTVLHGCTGCAFDGFSHRRRGDRRRHVVAAWRPSEPADSGASGATT